MILVLAASIALAGSRSTPTDEWVLVDDTALLCTHPGRAGSCVRFRDPGADAAAQPRVFRVVARRGAEVELQAQFDVAYALCGVLPANIAPLSLRLFAPASALQTLGLETLGLETTGDRATCVDVEARDEPGPGRDPVERRERVATVREGAWITWTDGTLAGRARRDLWLQDANGPYQDGDRWCASYALGPDDGGPVAQRVLDVCFHPSDLTLH